MTCSRLMQPGPRTAKPVPEATIVAADTLRARWRADAAGLGRVPWGERRGRRGLAVRVVSACLGLVPCLRGKICENSECTIIYF